MRHRPILTLLALLLATPPASAQPSVDATRVHVGATGAWFHWGRVPGTSRDRVFATIDLPPGC